MKNSEILYYLALQSAEGIGDINAKKLIAHCGSAQSVIEEKPNILEKIPGIGTYTIQGLKNKSIIRNAEKELEFINKNSIQATTYLDKNYPDKLKHCIDAPILLFQKGKINLRDQKIISIVGTRMITNYGKYFLEARNQRNELLLRGSCIVMISGACTIS